MAKLLEGEQLEQRARELGVDTLVNFEHKALQGERRVRRILNCNSASWKPNAAFANHGYGFWRLSWQ